MYTYQDLMEIKDDDGARMSFARAAIAEHKNSEIYKTAILANEYIRRRNRTIVNYRKLLYTMSGRTVPDNWSANYKMCSNYFDFFITQENQYLLGNGLKWQEESTAERLGKDFDTQMQTIGKKALIEGVAFGFWNLDHLDVFGISEFVPFYDEENGALMAGVRFWQIDKTKPLRATLYEGDGYTEYIWDDEGGRVLQPKRSYILHIRTTEIDGTEIYDGENYPTFPIVPLWASDKRQSELVGLQENIDAYDLIKSGFANDVDDCSQIYWVLKNAGGMDEEDLVRFLARMKTVHASNLDDGVDAQPHTIDIPYSARETLLTRLRDDLFEQAMAFDAKKLASGGSVVTAAIKAAYAPLDAKCDEFEYCIRRFLSSILILAGVGEDSPSFTRAMIINQSEQIQVVLQAAQYLDPEYVTTKVLTLLGDGDRADDMLDKMEAEEVERMAKEQALAEAAEAEVAEVPEEDEGNNNDEVVGIVHKALKG